MSKIEYGSFSVLSTGNKLPILNDSTLKVERVILFIAESNGETSTGYHDLSVDFTAGVAYGDKNTTNTLTHYRNISGVKTKVFEAKVTNMDTGEFTVNVSTITESPKSLRFIAFGS